MSENKLKTMPRVVCVVVNWNNWQDTAECLRSLQEQSYPDLHVIVVDNGSTNDSVAQLRAKYPWVTMIENGYNAGFPKACNVGVTLALEMNAEFLWLLNNDTTAPSDTAAKLIRKAVEDPQAGIIGAVLYYMHDPARVQAWGGGHVNLWTGYNRHFLEPETFGPDSYVTFASALIRRKVYEDLGGLYEGAFMYFEDSDFGVRAQQAGWKLRVAEDTAILHKEGASFKAKRNPMIERIVTMAGLSFLDRHSPVPPISMALFLSSKIMKRLLICEWAALAAVWKGASDWYRKKPIAVDQKA